MKYHWRYFCLVMRHKWYVFLAGRKIGVPLWRLITHDLSKFSRAEWTPYVNRFIKGRAGTFDKSSDPDEWHKAWNHHWHNNPHHWEYWLADFEFADTDLSHVSAMEMSYSYAEEMVADWMGASKAYTGSWDTTDWYRKNELRMILNPTTRAYVELIIATVKL